MEISATGQSVVQGGARRSLGLPPMRSRWLGPSSPRGRRDHLRLPSKEEGGHTQVTRDGHTQAIHRPSGRSEPASALIIYIMVPGGLRGHPPRGLRLPPPPFGHFAWWPGAVPSLPPSLPTLSTKPFLPSPSPPAAG